jgi:gluconolactonase
MQRRAHPGRLCLSLAFTAGWLLPLATGCSAGADGAPFDDNEVQSFAGGGGAAIGAGGSAGSGTGGVGGSAGTSAGGSAGTQGGTGGTGLVGGAGTSGSAGSSAGSSGSAGQGNGGSAGTGSGSNTQRVGAEACPAGPFPSPLPANVNTSITPIGSVGENDFFNWEGPVWTGDALYFSEIANDDSSQINRFVPGGSVERGVIQGTGSNGLALDASGDLRLAAHDVGAISRVDLPGGAITRGNQQFNSLRFNSPNDLVLRGDGNLYFTDPDFQSPSGRIQGATRVYRIAPDGQVSVVDATLDQPNGITMSPDGNTLYVTGAGVLREYSLDEAGVPSAVGNFDQALEVPDGMAIDCAGNIYAVENSARRVRVFNPDGDLIGTIGPEGLPGSGLTNVAFGGSSRRTLFISGFTQGTQPGLFSVELNVPGLAY